MKRTRVSINLESETYQDIDIREWEEGTGWPYEVPAELVRAYDQAYEALRGAERAVLRAAGFTYDSTNGWQPPARETTP